MKATEAACAAAFLQREKWTNSFRRVVLTLEIIVQGWGSEAKKLTELKQVMFYKLFYKPFLTYIKFIYFAFKEPVPWNPLGKELSHDLEWWTYLKKNNLNTNTRSVPNRYRTKLLKTSYKTLFIHSRNKTSFNPAAEQVNICFTNDIKL